MIEAVSCGGVVIHDAAAAYCFNHRIPSALLFYMPFDISIPLFPLLFKTKRKFYYFWDNFSPVGRNGDFFSNFDIYRRLVMMSSPMSSAKKTSAPGTSANNR